MNSKYRTQPFTIIHSASWGGIFAVYALLSRPDLFNAAIAATPWVIYDGDGRYMRDQETKKPLAWDRKAVRLGIRYRVFCASLADVFDTEVPEEWRADLFTLIETTPKLDWLLLTKRPKVAREFLTPRPVLPNVWLGTTVENQKMANLRVPLLLDTPATVRFLSMEPLLEEVDLYRGGFSFLHRIKSPTGKQHERLDWVICGGETGPHARDMNVAWARSLRDQCAGSSAAFFMKQMTRRAPIPADLLVREFPGGV